MSAPFAKPAGTGLGNVSMGGAVGVLLSFFLHPQ